MKAIFRNFFFVLKRFKTSSILNILGLSAAFAVFSVTLIQVYYDYSYDRGYSKSANIYQFRQLFNNGDRGITMPTTWGKEISEKFLEVKSYCLTNFYNDTEFDIPQKNGEKTKLTVSFTKVTAGFTT